MKTFHQNFSKWLQVTYPTGVDEAAWDTVLQEDACHPFELFPISYPNDPPPEQDDVTPADPANVHIELELR